MTMATTKKVLSPRNPDICKGILDGSIKYWFSDLECDKVYLYEEIDECGSIINGNCIDDECLTPIWCYQGTGKVIAEFSVGKRYENINDKFMLLPDKMFALYPHKLVGHNYTNQKYAYEIKDLIVYGEDYKVGNFNQIGKTLDISEFIDKEKAQDEYNEQKELLNMPYNFDEWINNWDGSKCYINISKPPTKDIYVVKV